MCGFIKKYAICSYPALSGSSAEIVTFSEMYIPAEAKEPELAKEFMKHIYEKSEQPSAVFTPVFETKSAENETLSDEFCALVVDIFKGDVKADEFAKKMLEYIKEF